MADKFLNDVGLRIVKQWIEGKFALDSDLDTLAERVEEIIAEGGEPNVIEAIKVNGTAQTVTNKTVDITVPEDLSDLTNTGNDPYAKESDLPTKTSDLTNDGDGTTPFATTAAATTSAAGLMSASDKTKLEGIEAGAEANVQSDWSQTTSSADDFIKNKPTKLSDFTNDGDGTTGSEFATKDYVDQNGGKIDKIKVNGTEQTITNKTVDISVPTATSDLTNDSGFQDATDVSGAIADALANSGDAYQTESDVDGKINTAMVGALKPKGSCAFANLPALTAANLNNVYNITDSFTTTADFVEGAGKTFPAGTEVAIINNGTEQSPSYKYSVYSGFVDLSAYWTSTSGQNNTLLAMTTAEINAILNPSS